MTQTPQPTIPHTEIPLSEREQSRGDTMESTLFNATSYSSDRVTARVVTAVEPGEEKVTALAMIQLLQRFRMESPKISTLVLRTVLSEKSPEVTQFIAGGDESLGRRLSLSNDGTETTLTVTGTPPSTGKDGAIVESAFDASSHPGKILSDGSIDFHELHRYPSVSVGDSLLTITLPGTPTEGLSYDGAPIIADEVKEYPIILGANVERAFITHEEKPAYEIRATKTGVIVATMLGKEIAGVDVSDRIVVQEIDFSVGNIGTDVVCPVSMDVGTVHEGFSVKVHGSMNIQTIDGGAVETGKEATVDQVLPGSQVVAEGNVFCRSVSSSAIKSNSGAINISREAIDTLITAPRVEMDSAASLLLNSTIQCCNVTLTNVRVSGTNRIILGPGLFERRNVLLADKKRVGSASSDVTEGLAKVKATLVDELKALSSEFGEDNTVRPIFKGIVDALKAYEFEKIPPLMGLLKCATTFIAVGAAQRTMDLLKRLLLRSWELEGRLSAIHEELNDIETKLNSLTFAVSARMRPSASVEIHFGDTGKDPLTIDPPTRINDEHFMKLVGQFNLKNGLSITEKSG